MNSLAARWLAIVAGVVIVAVAIGFYVNKLVRSPTPIAAGQTGPAQAQLTLGTTAAVGKLGQNPTWVSYLVREGDQWKHTTVFDVPAHSVVKVTVYNFDGASGLRNPFLSQVQGTVGGVMQVDGKTVKSIAARRRLAHLHRAADGDLRSDPRCCRRRPEPVPGDALLTRPGPRDGHLHDPHR